MVGSRFFFSALAVAALAGTVQAYFNVNASGRSLPTACGNGGTGKMSGSGPFCAEDNGQNLQVLHPDVYRIRMAPGTRANPDGEDGTAGLPLFCSTTPSAAR